MRLPWRAIKMWRAKRKKNIALKAVTYEEEVEENESEEDGDLALITRKFRKFMKGEKNQRKKIHF